MTTHFVIYIYIYIYIYTHTHTHTHSVTFIFMVCFIYTYIYIYIYTHTHIRIYIYIYIYKGKDKAVPLQAWSGSVGSRKLRFPDYMRTAQDIGKVVSLTNRPPLLPGNDPGTHFCWRLRWRPYCDRKDFMSMKNSNDTSWDRTSHLPNCSAAP